MTDYRNAHFLPDLTVTASVLTLSSEGLASLSFRPVIGWLSGPQLSHGQRFGGHSVPVVVPLVLRPNGTVDTPSPLDSVPRENMGQDPAPAEVILLGISPNREEAERSYGPVLNAIAELVAEISAEQEAAKAAAQKTAENAARAEREEAERLAAVAAEKVARRAHLISDADALIAESREFLAARTTEENDIA
ncbi:hypothetical protein ABT093_01300 [Kitasatospora sp. NPDC002551]|uniref:hypothetical protein n=1 Tax=Kitasatospora sp. NPDC002551 TaxID=3154539 RepID=UPI003328B5E8